MEWQDYNANISTQAVMTVNMTVYIDIYLHKEPGKKLLFFYQQA